VIDMSVEFMEIQARNIITITVGEDVSGDELEIWKFDKEGNAELKKMILRDAMRTINE